MRERAKHERELGIREIGLSMREREKAKHERERELSMRERARGMSRGRA